MVKSSLAPDPETATVSNAIKKKRQFTWTEKRKAQFAKLAASNLARRKSKKEEPQKETVAEDTEDMENVHAQNILKRIMDPHYLSKTDRHQEKEKESEKDKIVSSSDEDSSSSDEEEPEPKKVVKVVPEVPVKDSVQERVEILKSTKLMGKYKILKAKNKQLKNLIIDTKLKKKGNKAPSEIKIPPDSPEPVKKKPKKQENFEERELATDYAPSFYFC